VRGADKTSYGVGVEYGSGAIRSSRPHDIVRLYLFFWSRFLVHSGVKKRKTSTAANEVLVVFWKTDEGTHIWAYLLFWRNEEVCDEGRRKE
jgi:hypothetical protein